MTNETGTNFEEIKNRLDEIVDLVSDESISLDNALGLYEEAIKLGMQVSSLLEEDIAPEEVNAAVEALDSVEAGAVVEALDSAEVDATVETQDAAEADVAVEERDSDVDVAVGAFDPIEEEAHD